LYDLTHELNRSCSIQAEYKMEVD